MPQDKDELLQVLITQYAQMYGSIMNVGVC